MRKVGGVGRKQERDDEDVKICAEHLWSRQSPGRYALVILWSQAQRLVGDIYKRVLDDWLLNASSPCMLRFAALRCVPFDHLEQNPECRS